jgi:hypothetical protein
MAKIEGDRKWLVQLQRTFTMHSDKEDGPSLEDIAVALEGTDFCIDDHSLVCVEPVEE